MILSIHPDNPNPKGIRTVTECLKDGGVIVYPTDTIYGIGCDIFQPKAVERIAKIKDIELKKQNFSFICADLSQLADFTLPIDRATYRLMKIALPGPFTFILNANNNIPKLFKNNKKTVGIRIPKHNIPLALVKETGNPILTTSVHNDDEIIEYITNPELIYEKLKNNVDIVIDGGSGQLKPSTVISCTTESIEIIREGAGNLDDLF